MTTKKQMKSLFDVLVARNSDLVVKEHRFFKVPYLLLKPVRHVCRAISIDRTSRADCPVFHWHVGHCFSPHGRLDGLAWEWFWMPRGRPNQWSEPGFTETAVETIENSILPMLRRAQTIDDMFRIEGFPRSFEYDSALAYRPFRISMSAALGNWEEALAVYEETRHGAIREWELESHQKAFELGALVAAGDRAAVIALLHQWEDEFVARNGLEDIYERTSFPVEHI